MRATWLMPWRLIDGSDILAVISLAQLNSELRIDGQDGALTRVAMPYAPE